MKIIIAHASAGTGHLKAAEALHHSFKESYPGVDVRLVDALDFSSAPFRFIYRSGYSILVKYAPWLWSLIFRLTGIKAILRLAKGVNLGIDLLNIRDFSEFLIRENPDAIVSTHFTPPEIAAYLKKNSKIKSLLISVITDFGVHPFWLADGTDIYIAASEFSRNALMALGVKEGNIRVFGIPVDSKFLEEYDREALCRKLGIERERFTVLIATGSFGIGPIEEIVELLHQDAQLLVVCANNKSLYLKLKSRGYKGVRVFGFIDNIQELMSASDILIGKPGGLTISEGLVMNLYQIFIAAIPGQESENARALEAGGAGVYINDTACIKKLVLDLRDNPQKLGAIKKNIARIRRPRAAGEICDVVCQGSIRASH